MADAKKCDRCGKSSYNNDGYFDLCPECSESLNKWINFFKDGDADNE